MVCAGGAGRDVCGGRDTGTAMVCDKSLAGVLSWGVGCGRPGVPAVFTQIYEFSQWIQDRTK